MAHPWPTHRKVAWLLRYVGPACDRQLETMLASMFKTPPSTVRGARKRLEKRGVVKCVGLTRDGRRKWKLV